MSSPKINYSVFLIKEEYEKFGEILDEEKLTYERDIKSIYDLNAKIYFGENEGRTPTWFNEIRDGVIEPPDNLENQSTRAVLLVKRKHRIFAFTFGHGKHLIDSSKYVRGFGMKIVVNNCEVSKLKSIDSAKIDSITVQARSQTSKSTELNDFHIDNTRDLMKALTAEADDFERYGKVIAGRDSFHFYNTFSFEWLNTLCDQLLDDYKSSKYKENFEWIDHLREVTDPTKKEELNEKLIDQINETEETGLEIHLAPPEIIDMKDGLVYSYLKNGEKFVDLEFEEYLSIKKPKKGHLYTADKLKRDKIHVYDSNGELIDDWTIFNCIVAEVKLAKETYVLSLGMWYKVDNSFVEKINADIKNIPTSPLQFQPFDPSEHRCENEYNNTVAQNNDHILSMDKGNIEYDNGRFEFCDLLTKDKRLIHVKPWNRSATLSHLFAQGRISAQTLINDPGIIEQVNDVIRERGGDDEYFIDSTQQFSPQKFTVVYAIIYKGDKEIHERIPFFSKLNFIDSVKTLRGLSFNIEKMHIEKVEEVNSVANL